MKKNKVLSLILVLCMVLMSVSFAFADADASFGGENENVTPGGAVVQLNAEEGTTLPVEPVTETHVHDDSCYANAGDLKCTLHIHDENCYEDVRNDAPACGKTANTIDHEPGCGFDEGKDCECPAHQHVDGCFIAKSFTCQIESDHEKHGDDCYYTEKTLICGKEETKNEDSDNDPVVPGEEVTEESNDIYVSAQGSDENGNGTLEAPYATLKKCADVIGNKETGKTYTIKVMTDLTSTACARFYGRDVVITSVDGEGNPCDAHTVTRGDGFATISDNARSWYNASMIEVQVTGSANKGSLTITDLILDDANLRQTYVNAKGQTVSTDFKAQATSGDTSKNLTYAQSAIIETTPDGVGTTTITLGSGAVLKNYGGMSAVRLTPNATLYMNAGSSIVGGGNGQGAVWSIGATVNMNNGAVITGMTGANGIFANGGTVLIDGEIYDNNFSHALQAAANVAATVGKNGYIHNNRVNYGAVYMNGEGDTLELYGKVNYNTSSDRAGGVAVSNNGSNKISNMYDGAEIIGNVSEKEGAGGLLVSCGTFTMEGGTISDNKVIINANGIGGGVHIRRGGIFIMNGGTITNNEAKYAGGGIAFDAGYYGTITPMAILNGGTISGNIQNGNVSNDIAVIKTTADAIKKNNSGYGYIDSYLVINGASVGNKDIYYDNGDFFVNMPQGTKNGNASNNGITALTNAADAMGWDVPLATMWRQSGKAEFVFGGLTTKDAYKKDLPVYVVELQTNADGTAIERTETVYKATVSGDKISVELNAAGDNGTVLAVVQPKEDLGEVEITTTPEITYDKNAEDYIVDFTVTFTPDEAGNLINQIKAGGVFGISLRAMLDQRLSIIDDETITFESDLFEVTNPNSRGSNLLYGLKVKDAAAANQVTVIKFKAKLAAEDFEEGETLDSTAMANVEFGQSQAIIPGNIAKTLMTKKSYTVTFDPNGGAFNPNGRFEAGFAYDKETGCVVGVIKEGTVITIIAAPDTMPEKAESFEGWKGAETLQPETQFTVDADCTFTAQWKMPAPPVIIIPPTEDPKDEPKDEEPTDEPGEEPGDEPGDEPDDEPAVDIPDDETPTTGADEEDEDGYFSDGSDEGDEDGYYTDAPTDVEEEDVPTSDVPKTGDSMNLMLYVALAGVAAAVMTRRRKADRQ